MKRAFDFFVSAVGLLILAPVMGVLAILIRRSSPGPALFVQMRVGRFERPFRCYKFRTMAVGAPIAGTHEVSSKWLTPIGRCLRASKADELPQLYNVLRGDMSLVGPRPCLPSQSDVIRARIARDVFSIRPGITGPAQLTGIDMSMPDKLAEADQDYMIGRSIVGDLEILLATFLGRGSDRDRRRHRAAAAASPWRLRR